MTETSVPRQAPNQVVEANRRQSARFGLTDRGDPIRLCYGDITEAVASPPTLACFDADMNSTVIKETLRPLVGLPLRSIGRAADMLWVHFGEFRQLRDRRGATRSVGEWALHVQCPWRVTRPPAILVARGDCFYRADGDEPYDWDAGGESRFDRCAAALNREFESLLPRVEAIAVDEDVGFALRLSGGYVFEVLPDNSTGSATEQWRFFQPGRDAEHFVVPGDDTYAG